MGGCKLAHQAAQTANRRQRDNEYEAECEYCRLVTVYVQIVICPSVSKLPTGIRRSVRAWLIAGAQIKILPG